MTQLSYEADADAVAEALSVDGRRPTVRLVTDQAAAANGRKHAGLAYAVYDTAGDATKAAAENIVKSYYRSFNMPCIITRGNNGPRTRRACRARRALLPARE